MGVRDLCDFMIWRTISGAKDDKEREQIMREMLGRDLSLVTGMAEAKAMGQSGEKKDAEVIELRPVSSKVPISNLREAADMRDMLAGFGEDEGSDS